MFDNTASDYLEATLCVGGAVDAIEQFTDASAFAAWLDGVKADLADSEEEAEVYTLNHPHSPGIECECAQYVTDGRPHWTNTVRP